MKKNNVLEIPFKYAPRGVELVGYESIIIHILMFASASLYIPISVSIKRKAQLVSIIKNKPDRFILYQTIGLAAFKVSSLRLHINTQLEADRPRDNTFYYANYHDFYTTPVMIEMSYLFSNKRNFDTIKNIFKRNNRTMPSSAIGAAQASSVDT
ncbi:Protein CBG22837 [Caenorhabditis briggsae]|uniref:Protein CBG22837 n=1 Tax=Caenorhabditis briggsae TaxID=6238 RepID=A8Y361_CAEBR|nr:Protein CBG22837 [Caenorhabditis briggsae]CAP39330.2 Protein CBG22837 [Caenorhabditis briggsae]